MRGGWYLIVMVIMMMHNMLIMNRAMDHERSHAFEYSTC